MLGPGAAGAERRGAEDKVREPLEEGGRPAGCLGYETGMREAVAALGPLSAI